MLKLHADSNIQFIFNSASYAILKVAHHLRPSSYGKVVARNLYTALNTVHPNGFLFEKLGGLQRY